MRMSKAVHGSDGLEKPPSSHHTPLNLSSSSLSFPRFSELGVPYRLQGEEEWVWLRSGARTAPSQPGLLRYLGGSSCQSLCLGPHLEKFL